MKKVKIYWWQFWINLKILKAFKNIIKANATLVDHIQNLITENSELENKLNTTVQEIEHLKNLLTPKRSIHKGNRSKL